MFPSTAISIAGSSVGVNVRSLLYEWFRLEVDQLTRYVSRLTGELMSILSIEAWSL
ncbi:MAG: hypothetical protein QW305_05065 [Candidatus Bathyarchaeia archaeon]